MANKLFGTKLFATALTTFALASCQSESTLLEPSADNMRDVKLTVTASKGELTRTNLELNDDQKKILLSWNLGDLIQVCEEDGRFAGTLQVTSFADDAHTQAKFEGNVRVLDRDGNHNLSFYYLGTAAEYKGVKGRQMADMVYDLSTQTYTDVNALAANDLLLDECEVTVTKGNAEFKSLFMERQFAYGRFTLLYNDEPLKFDANTVVSINTEKGDIKTGATVDFPSEITANGGSSISLTTSENDFYVTFVPGSEESKIKFNVTINGNEYEGYSNPYLIEKNDFFRKAQGLTKAEALPINMRRTDGSDDEHNFSLIYNANYGSNDTWTDNQEGVGNSCTFTLSEYAKIFDETNEGYTFTGWNTMADGTGESLLPNSTLTVAYPDGIANVYAQWEKTEYNWQFVWVDDTVFGENAVTYGKKNEAGSLPKTLGSAFPTDLEGNPWYKNMVKDGYTFLGWEYKGKMVSKNGNTYSNKDIVVTELPETVIELNGNTYYQVFIYAKWEKATYDLVLNCYNNDGTDTKSVQTEYNKTLPYTMYADDWNVPTRTGYKFVGWGMTPDATETITSVTFTTPDPINVYAIWKKDVSGGSIVAPGAGGSDY